MIAPEYREATVENFRKRWTGEAVDRYELEVVTKEGNRIPLELNTRTLEYKGEFMGLEGVAREIVDKRKVLLDKKRLLEELRGDV